MNLPLPLKQLSSRQQQHVEALLAFGTITLDALQDLAALNLNTGRPLFQDALRPTQSLFGTDGIQDILQQHAARSSDAVAKATAYAQTAQGILGRAQADVTKLQDAQWSMACEDAFAFIDQCGKSGLPTADKMADAFKSFLAQSNAARESLLNVASVFAENAETQVAVATYALNDVNEADALAKPEQQVA